MDNAGLLAHRFLSDHPFSDGNGRTGRLLATAELWRSSYRMRGFLSFDERFAADRAAHYDALQMDLPVDFYDGRHDPDHSPWLEYFVGTVARTAEDLLARAVALQRAVAPPPPPWKELDRRQQQVLVRLAFGRSASEIRPPELAEWLRSWTEGGLLEPMPTRGGARVRRYRLARRWVRLTTLAQAGRRD